MKLDFNMHEHVLGIHAEVGVVSNAMEQSWKLKDLTQKIQSRVTSKRHLMREKINYSNGLF